jgi:acyl-CoA thioesterase FadM
MRTAQGFTELYTTPVRPEWVDYNGHMSEAFYVLVFGYTTDALLDRIGLDEAGRQRQQASIFTVEAHVCYLQEAAEGETLLCGTRILDMDSKRVHAFHGMWHADTGQLLATEELMLLHVCTHPETKTAPMSEDVYKALAEMHQGQAGLNRPKQAGRSIGIHRPS